MGNAPKVRTIRLSTTPTPEALAELRLGDVVETLGEQILVAFDDYDDSPE